LLDLIWVKAVFKALLLPPAGPMLIALTGVVCLRRARVGRTLVVLGTLLLWTLSTPAVAWLLLRVVETAPPLDVAKARTTQAVVILGGGVRRNAVEYGGDTLARLTLERVRYGARVARLTGLPVLVAGGSMDGGVSEAVLMRRALQDEFGIEVRWTEEESRNTRENAVHTAQVLGPEHVTRIVLVAHSFDMRRAVAEFTRAGLEVVPAPTVIPPGQLDRVSDYWPSVGGLQGSYYALYEILGNAAVALDP
jgi:uncharacterized SAM-binding protein YcdF (DUF218 family)